ncbi:S8 family serine peptidase, partial [candidate division WOR-3 bacterium]|nr:S8 family serine peptidase [candidate division WOR-3 bacterium]
NVKLAMFDTGIKLTNRGISRARIYKQHDFISGDNCYAARSSSSWQPSAVDGIRFLGFARGLALHTVQTESGSRDTLLMTFCADSFAYGYNTPRRAVFASSSFDGGDVWTSPVPLVMSTVTGATYENLTLAGHGSVTYLAYNQLAIAINAPAIPTVYLGFFTGTSWQGNPQLVSSGRYPAMAVVADTLYLAFVQSDSLVSLRKSSVAQAEPTLLDSTVFTTGEPLADLQVAAESGIIDVFATGLKSGRLAQYRSTDGGATFAKLNEPVAAGAARTRLMQHEAQRLLVYEDRSDSAFSRLAALGSTDNGLNWHQFGTVTDSLFWIGGFDVTSNTPSGITLVYETDGFLYRTGSTDFGATWSVALLTDTTGFNAMPALTETDDGPVAFWFKRGDDSAVWQTTDTARFSVEQPYHGTRMASIVAGYQQSGVVGVAPGVDLLIAKTELYKVRSGRFYEYSMEEDAYIEALEWADRMGADVVSTSLGYRNWYGPDQFDGRTAPISIAASIAAKRGMLIVAAMGNRTDDSDYPWPVPYIVAPGDAEGVITAGGVEKDMLPWRGTGTGPTSDGRTKPDLVALSDTVAVVSPDSEDYLDGSVGTSCATALIAGACALVKEAHPEWSADSIKAVLFATATRSVKSDTFGFGVPRIDSIYKLFPPEKQVVSIPDDRIGPIFPNPFVPASQTRVYFPIFLARPAPFDSAHQVPDESPVVISIFSMSGSLVDTVNLNTRTMGRPGRYGENGDVAVLEQIGAYWDARNEAGKPVAAGLYLAVLQTTFGRSTTKFAVVR